MLLKTAPTGSATQPSVEFYPETTACLEGLTSGHSALASACFREHLAGTGADRQVHVARGDGCAAASHLLELRLVSQVLFHDARSTKKRPPPKKNCSYSGSFISSEILFV